MAEKNSDAQQTETNNSSKRERTASIVTTAILGATALALPVMFIVEAYRSDRRQATDTAPATAAARADGFGLTGFEDGTDSTVVDLKIPSDSGASCVATARALITRDASGKLIDLHNYSLSGYANPHMEWQGTVPHQRQALTGEKFVIDFENLDQLQLIAGGPQHDFCADQAAVVEFQATPVPTS